MALIMLLDISILGKPDVLRIAIVNDNPVVGEILRQVLLGGSGYQVAWVAEDGPSAVLKCAEDRPDLILMDLVADGVSATCRIMRETPCAILIVTSDMGGKAGKVFEAMGCGALDVVATPVLGPDSRIKGGKELLDKIARISRLATNRGKGADESRAGRKRPMLVAIGSSAGGPKALATIVGALPADFPGAVVIVQHIDARFAPGLAQWLAGQTSLPVSLVKETRPVAVGTIAVACGGKHLVVAPDLRLTHTVEPRDAPYIPSIDVFFSSLAEYWPEPALAVLLTGMGKDGASSLLRLRRAGWHTIAQDESSSVVYGMPRAAADIGAAAEVLPLSEIAAAILEYSVKDAFPKGSGG